MKIITGPKIDPGTALILNQHLVEMTVKEMTMKVCNVHQVSLIDNVLNLQIHSPSFCAVDGQWGHWGEWTSECRLLENKNGQKWMRGRTRNCSNPEPKYGGRHCNAGGEKNFTMEVCDPGMYKS